MNIVRVKKCLICHIRMKKYDNYIGIDPDVEKSGVAFLEYSTRKLEVSNMTFPALLDYLRFVKDESIKNNQSVIVIIEAGYLNHSNWHLKNSDTKRVASAKGNSTGRNHEIARKLVEMCRHYGLEVEEQRPLKKCWSGKDGKITHEELASFTGLMGKTNQDARDSALLAWYSAGFQIMVKSFKNNNNVRTKHN